MLEHLELRLSFCFYRYFSEWQCVILLQSAVKWVWLWNWSLNPTVAEFYIRHHDAFMSAFFPLALQTWLLGVYFPFCIWHCVKVVARYAEYIVLGYADALLHKYFLPCIVSEAGYYIIFCRLNHICSCYQRRCCRNVCKNECKIRICIITGRL